MRILFVSGTSIGGSALSTRELASRLAVRGHEVAIVCRVELGPNRRQLHKRAINLVTKLGASPLARPVDAVAAQIGRRPRRRPDAAVPEWEAIVVENALPRILEERSPDVVVASSIGRVAWRRIRADLARRGVPSALYLREETSLGHLAISNAPPDLLLANAHALVEEAARLGFDARMVPSVITLGPCLVESTRERVLYVNPVHIQGVDIALDLAEARPAVPFVFQEWWTLPDAARTEITTRLGRLPDAVLRAPVDVRELYRDASVLLAPFRFNGRSRLVLEAQANGIPVLGSDRPAVVESVGPGGVCVPLDAPVADWAAALDELVGDPDRYRAYCAAALQHAARDEVNPDAIVAMFEAEITRLVERHPVRR